MHEIYVASEILKEVQNQASRYANSRVTHVRILVGTYAAVDLSSLMFALEAISLGSPLEGAKVDIEGGASDIVCEKCGRTPTLTAQNGKAKCPKCGKTAPLGPGTEIYIEEMELDGAENSA
ncbi:hydrogenase maturation nickel metallochaperone HypA [Candidatus Sumerlaeota bacterium]|nr:hydrogenase maturation nickel metallochaperone HypA [Candidatus Sumerlaeota bacterium]